MFVYLYVVAPRALLGSNGSSPEAEAKGLPFGIVRAAVSLSHSSAARQVCWAPREEKGVAGKRRPDWPPLARCCARCVCVRCLRSRIRG